MMAGRGQVVDDITSIRRARLQHLLDTKYNGVQTALSAALSRSPSYVWGLLQEGPNSKPIGEKLARHIEKSASLPEYWLDGLARVVHSAPINRSGLGNLTVSGSGQRRIPVISFVEAGKPVEAIDAYAVGAGSEELVTDLELGPYAFGLIVQGDSMLPEFKEGDRILIDPDVQPKPGDFVVARTNNGEVTFKKYRPKRISERGDEVFGLVPLNEDYATIWSDEVPCTIVGVLVEHRRQRRR